MAKTEKAKTETFKQGEIVTDGDQLLIVDKVPTLTDDSYEVSSYESVDDLGDNTALIGDPKAGTRSMGGAVGTTHKEERF